MAAAARRRGAGGSRGPRKASRGGVGVRACGGRRRSDSRGEVKLFLDLSSAASVALLLPGGRVRLTGPGRGRRHREGVHEGDGICVDGGDREERQTRRMGRPRWWCGGVGGERRGAPCAGERVHVSGDTGGADAVRSCPGPTGQATGRTRGLKYERTRVVWIS
jgi:hypothetical protein